MNEKGKTISVHKTIKFSVPTENAEILFIRAQICRECISMIFARFFFFFFFCVMCIDYKRNKEKINLNFNEVRVQ